MIELKGLAMLSAEQLSEIVAAYRDVQGVDQLHHNRRAPRVIQGGKSTIYRPAGSPQDAAVQVQLRDLSARGCSFTVKEKFQRGSNFIIQFSRKEQSPVAVLCTVMHCRTAGDQFRIGAEFTCVIDRRARSPEADDAEQDRIRNSILT